MRRRLLLFRELMADKRLVRSSSTRLETELAGAADQRRLAGAVFGIKDVIAFQNHNLTAGSQILKGYGKLLKLPANLQMVQ